MMNYEFSLHEKNYNKCKLEDGSIHDYDLAAGDKNAYQDIKHKLIYLGKGTHYSCNGILQKDSLEGHFWIWKKEEEETP